MPLIIGLLLAVGTVLAGAYLWINRASSSAAAGPQEQVIIATNTAYAGTCPVIVARENGYFAHEGILAVLQPQSSGKAAMASVLQGQANLGTVADIPVMFEALNNRPVSVIATIFKTEKDHGIVGRKDRGIATIASLKGKRIGVTQITSGHFALDALLNRQKLSPSDITMHNYKPEELSAALEQGEVDAIATWQPYLDASFNKLGSNGVIFYGEDVYTSLYAVAGMRDYVAGHPQTMQKVLRALIQGARFCSEVPDSARELVAGMTKNDASILKTAWPSYQFNIALDQGLLLALEDEARWAIKNKLTSKTEIPNYLNYIYLDGLEAVMPTAVTLIH
ncbi:ABC transporter substrate-binding protein [Andreprevotia chitinilytica]|uniref:ABC transporter substrate-binding protein n=1 Tax=Andreprevotia chitinilytica TaxID=396808 RepID=UPI001B805B74|nr:NrtA/SsuA/CpmA family ABC transporter substrate-binding protein [Andreprevotia chitinilytica]